MDQKKIIIAGSIGAVVVGLLVVGVLIYRSRVLAPVTEAPAATGEPAPAPGGGLNPGQTGGQPGTGTSTSGGSQNGGPIVLTATSTHPIPPPDYTGGKDSDGDGLSDGEETDFYRTDPNKSDTDGDGYSDYDETKKYGSDPLDPNSTPKTIPGHAKFGL